MKKKADQNRREVEFQVGELVYLKIQPYRLNSLAARINQKLSPRYYGPFKIVERMGAVAYKLELPPRISGSSSITCGIVEEMCISHSSDSIASNCTYCRLGTLGGAFGSFGH